MPLSFQVFQHSYEGFNGTSTLICGENDAVLIDACSLLSDAHALAAELLLTRKNITHLYVSHFHPDHHWGSGVIKTAFPEIKVVALPSVVRDITLTMDDKLELWGDALGSDNIPEKPLVPEPLSEAFLEVEGHRVEFSDDWDGDCANNTMIWVPSLRLACGTDIVYNDAHPWTAESDAARRNKWRACLRKLESWEPLVVVPGHCSPEKLHVDNTEGIAFTLKYLDVYEEVLAGSRTGDELVLGMEKHYPGMKAIDYGVHWQARILFPQSCSDWITPLPGFFLAPGGEFMGETARTA